MRVITTLVESGHRLEGVAPCEDEATGGPAHRPHEADREIDQPVGPLRSHRSAVTGRRADGDGQAFASCCVGCCREVAELGVGDPIEVTAGPESITPGWEHPAQSVSMRPRSWRASPNPQPPAGDCGGPSSSAVARARVSASSPSPTSSSASPASRRASSARPRSRHSSA